jgi:hypothetical protein
VPDYHKFGGRFINTATMNLVGRLGVPIDTTVEPGAPAEPPGEHHGGIFRGTTADFSSAPRRPYRPDANNFCREATGKDAGLWELPMTSGFPMIKPSPVPAQAEWALTHPIAAARSLARKLHRPPSGHTNSEIAPAYRPLSMWLNWQSPSHFWDAAFATVAEIDQPYLAFGVRSELPLVSSLRDTFEGIVNHLNTDPRARKLVFETPAQLLDGLGVAHRRNAELRDPGTSQSANDGRDGRTGFGPPTTWT